MVCRRGPGCGWRPVPPTCARGSTVWRRRRRPCSVRIRSRVTCFAFAAAAGSGRHSTSFASESWEPEGLILLKALVELGTTADDFTNACLDHLSIEGGDRDLPRCGLHQLYCGEHALADQLVERADANAKPCRGSIGANCLSAR